ncbi:uncharacterized protein LOC106643732 [Copidosoma floridanum]|uniref:uncharacterized protein LOC106643732 n=1 Tax=Copidosoma floridanum TaxID=29053 RepID=UPI0006C9546A|nr:uncharacterized protein LOC106643732 [Copidosoma floridanum]
MVKKQQKARLDGGVRIPVSNRLAKHSNRRKRPPSITTNITTVQGAARRLAVVRMLSQEYSEGEPGVPGTSTGCKDEGAAGSSSGAVTPSGFVNGEGTQEFLSTGRTGRRNAMPDILGQYAETGTADLPEKLEALSTDPGNSSRSQAEASSSEQQQQRAG